MCLHVFGNTFLTMVLTVLVLRMDYHQTAAVPAFYVCPSACKCGYNVTVSCSAGLQMIPGDISSLTKSLHLAGNTTTPNTLTHIRRGDLSNLSDLRYLTLSFSSIQTIDDGVFIQIKELRQLRLNNNQIKQLSAETFTGLSNLEILDLSGNPNIQIQPGTFRHLLKLRELYLGDTLLDELNTNMFGGVTALKVLDIHGNSLKTLDSETLNFFPDLSELDISSNALTTLEDEVWTSISNLQTFYIDDNFWRCNCQMKFLKTSPSFNDITNAIICSGPDSLQYMQLSFISESDLKCLLPQIISCDEVSLDLTEGESLSISCNISGDPFPEMEWRHPNGDIIHTSSHIGQYHTSENKTLHVPVIYLEDAGVWILTTSNVQGSVEKEFLVTVKVITTSIMTTITDSTTHSVEITSTTTVTPTTTIQQQPPPTRTATVATHEVVTPPSKKSSMSQYSSASANSPSETSKTASLFTNKRNSIMTTVRPMTSWTMEGRMPGNGDDRGMDTGVDGATYVGIIVVAVGAGCSVIIITSLCVLLFQYIKRKNKVGDSIMKIKVSEYSPSLAFA